MAHCTKYEESVIGTYSVCKHILVICRWNWLFWTKI